VASLGGLQRQPQHGTYFVRLGFRFSRHWLKTTFSFTHRSCSSSGWQCLVVSLRSARLDLFKSPAHNLSMKSNAIRTSIDLPRDLHRRVHEAAARKGCSARKLILAGIERAVEEAKVSRPIRRLSLDQPLIRPAGRRIRVTNEEAYELIELP